MPKSKQNIKPIDFHSIVPVVPNNVVPTIPNVNPTSIKDTIMNSGMEMAKGLPYVGPIIKMNQCSKCPPRVVDNLKIRRFLQSLCKIIENDPSIELLVRDKVKKTIEEIFSESGGKTAFKQAVENEIKTELKTEFSKIISQNYQIVYVKQMLNNYDYLNHLIRKYTKTTDDDMGVNDIIKCFTTNVPVDKTSFFGMVGGKDNPKKTFVNAAKDKFNSFKNNRVTGVINKAETQLENYTIPSAIPSAPPAPVEDNPLPSAPPLTDEPSAPPLPDEPSAPPLPDASSGQPVPLKEDIKPSAPPFEQYTPPLETNNSPPSAPVVSSNPQCVDCYESIKKLLTKFHTDEPYKMHDKIQDIIKNKIKKIIHDDEKTFEEQKKILEIEKKNLKTAIERPDTIEFEKFTGYKTVQYETQKKMTDFIKTLVDYQNSNNEILDAFTFNTNQDTLQKNNGQYPNSPFIIGENNLYYMIFESYIKKHEKKITNYLSRWVNNDKRPIKKMKIKEALAVIKDGVNTNFKINKRNNQTTGGNTGGKTKRIHWNNDKTKKTRKNKKKNLKQKKESKTKKMCEKIMHKKRKTYKTYKTYKTHQMRSILCKKRTTKRK